MVEIKICGVTRLDDARLCAELGVEWLGLNFWAGSSRRCSVEEAREIVEAVGARMVTVGVFVDASTEEIQRTLRETGVQLAQLHGDEPPEQLRELAPRAFKALKTTGPEVFGAVERYAGEHLLLDAHVQGAVGGTGQTANWEIARSVAELRPLTLAGGLTAENVGRAIARVRPVRVDTASGVEQAPGRKDPARLEAFVAAVRATDSRR